MRQAPQCDPGFLLLQGRGAAPGIACGPLSRNGATREADDVAGSILVAERATPDDVGRILASSGTLTLGGSLLSHVSLLSREFGKPSVSLDTGSRVRMLAEDERGAGVLELTDVVGAGDPPVLAEGDVVLLDGDRGLVHVPGGTDPASRERVRCVHERLVDYARCGEDDAARILEELLREAGDGPGVALDYVIEAGVRHGLAPPGPAARRLIAALLAAPGRRRRVEAHLEHIRHSALAAARRGLAHERAAIRACEDIDDLERTLQRLDREVSREIRLLADLGGDPKGQLAAIRDDISREAESRRGAIRSALDRGVREALALPDDLLEDRLGGYFRLVRRSREAGVSREDVTALESRLRERKARIRGRVGDSLVVSLQSGDPLERSRVGGKAAGLLEVRPALPAGCVLPRGFVVTVSAYRLHLLGEAGERLRAALREPDEAGVSRRARAAILSSAVPDEVSRSVAAALDELRVELLAVRSSASIEDGPTSSLAGQFDTALGIRGLDELLHRIKQTWASLWNARALRAMAAAGISPVDAGQAVLVQEMVATRSAGVLVTRDPGGRPDTLLINATWGLGEGISQGEVPGDLYWVRRSTGEILSAESGRDTKRIALDPGGPGTIELPLEAGQIGRPSLSEEQVARLADLARTLEETTGRAQDVEFGFTDDGTLIVFQVRRVVAGRRRHELGE